MISPPSRFLRAGLLRGAIAGGLLCAGASMGGAGGALSAQEEPPPASFCAPPDSIVYTPDRGRSELETVARSVCVLDGAPLRGGPGSSLFDAVGHAPSVHRLRTGILGERIVQRGFNTLLSGPMVFLEDYRPADLPAFRLNAVHMLSSSALDLARVELLPGGASPLYGGSASGGVLHVLTASPLDDPGTRITFGAGERGVLEGALRQVVPLGTTAALRLSGHYFEGDEWEGSDPVEGVLRTRAIAAGADPATLLVGARDPGAARWGVGARLDVRPGPDTDVVVSGGTTTAMNNLEPTGAGAVQARSWRLSHAQARATHGGLFGQVHGTLSQSGDSYMLRTGQPVGDRSWRAGARLQQTFRVGPTASVIVGADADRTQVGNEEGAGVLREDVIDDFGLFARGRLHLTREWTLSGGLRADVGTELEDMVISPGVQIAFTPGDGHTVHAGASRSFSAPTPAHLLLDFASGDLPVDGLMVPTRARGVPRSGFTFGGEPGVCAGGLGDFCMRSPFVPGSPRMPVESSILWNPVLFQFAPLSVAPYLAALLDPAVGEVATAFQRLTIDGTGSGEAVFRPDPIGPRDVERLRPSFASTLEIGYRGSPVPGTRLQVDLFASQVRDMVGPLRVETPTVFFDQASVAAFLERRLLPLVQAGRLTNAEMEGTVASLSGILAGVPLGAVTPDQAQGAEHLLTYRNVGDAQLFGGELSLEVELGATVTLLGSYGHLSTVCLRESDANDEEGCSGQDDVALNAPSHQGGGGLRYREPGGRFRTEARVRARGGYPVDGGLVTGTVDGARFVDLLAAIRLPWIDGAELTVSGLNLLDERRRDFPGGPEAGRLVVLRLGYIRP